MEFKLSNRLNQLPPYLFMEIDKKKKAAIEKGVDIISLGVGDPDLATPDFIIEALYRAAKDKANHQYPFGAGLMKFREAVSRWYHRRFGVDLDPKDEVVALIGSKEGIGHLPLGILNPGDISLIPSPRLSRIPRGNPFRGRYFLFHAAFRKERVPSRFGFDSSGGAGTVQNDLDQLPQQPNCRPRRAGFLRKTCSPGAETQYPRRK